MHLSDTASILQPCIQVLPVIEGSREYMLFFLPGVPGSVSDMRTNRGNLDQSR